ncbi:MAG: ATP-binding protein [Bacteroidales bacterium]|nr:ATP-binding protein [Bacteroidales bacterium]
MANIHVENSISIASEISNVAEVEALIDNQSAMFKFDDDVYGKLLLAVVEAVNNAIVHGNKSDSSKQVNISYVIESDYVEYSISDSGEGFDPNCIPDPTELENIEKFSGRGLFLMKNLSDEMEFSDNGRKVRLKFLLNTNDNL